MACGACGSSKVKAQTYTWTSADGKTTQSFRTEVEAKAKKARSGGDYKAS
jgi:hypothetical protein